MLSVLRSICVAFFRYMNFIIVPCLFGIIIYFSHNNFILLSCLLVHLIIGLEMTNCIRAMFSRELLSIRIK